MAPQGKKLGEPRRRWRHGTRAPVLTSHPHPVSVYLSVYDVACGVSVDPEINRVDLWRSICGKHRSTRSIDIRSARLGPRRSTWSTWRLRPSVVSISQSISHVFI